MQNSTAKYKAHELPPQRGLWGHSVTQPPARANDTQGEAADSCAAACLGTTAATATVRRRITTPPRPGHRHGWYHPACLHAGDARHAAGRRQRALHTGKRPGTESCLAPCRSVPSAYVLHGYGYASHATTQRGTQITAEAVGSTTTLTVA